jgi:putative transcriptional regulator
MTTGKPRVETNHSTESDVDWERIRNTTEEDIDRQIAEDPDTAPRMGGSDKWIVHRNPPVPNVRRIREQLGISQAEFASRFGLSVRTIQQWEQGRAVPDQPARVLLKVIEHAPTTVTRALRAS